MRPLFRQMRERLDGMGTEVLLQRDADPATGPNQLRDRQVSPIPSRARITAFRRGLIIS